MSIAAILPTPLLGEIETPPYHLCLAHLVLQAPQYRRYYRSRAVGGDFVILDNSAHEHRVGEGPEVLTIAARLILPSEIVLPDVLFDADETVRRSREAASKLRDLGVPLMVVPQGKSLDEWKKCLDELMSLDPDTVGISKDFEVWGLWGLTPLIEYCHQFGKPIHLLGWGRRLELLPIYIEAGRGTIRGIDSAKPAVYARAGIRLPEDLRKAPPYPGRPPDFFSTDSIDREILGWNISVFHRAAGDLG